MAKTKDKLTPKQKEFLVIFRKKAGMIYLSCEAANIVPQTYYNWLKNSEIFREKVKFINELTKDFAESTLLQNMKMGKSSDLHFYLERKVKDRGYGKNMEITVSEGNAIELGDIPEYMVEDLEWEDD